MARRRSNTPRKRLAVASNGLVSLCSQRPGRNKWRAFSSEPGTNHRYCGPVCDTTTNGGSTAFSISTETASITVSGVNNAPTFDAGMEEIHPLSGKQFGNAVAQQTDGKYVMVGWSDAAGTRDFIVAGITSTDRSIHLLARTGYVVTAIGTGNDETQDVRILADGKILVVGYAANGGNGTDIAIARYNADGSLDTTFGSGTGRVMSGWAGEDNAPQYGNSNGWKNRRRWICRQRLSRCTLQCGRDGR